MIIAFFFSSIVISFSTIGYGILAKNLLGLNYKNVGLSGLLGLFFLSIISSYTHLFLPHNFIHNIIIISIGLILYFFKRKNNLKDIKISTLVFILLFICLILSKNNEDFGYYHLPNSIQFAQQKLQFGIGNLNHGFKHISLLFQMMSLHYLPYFKTYLFNLTNFLFYYFLIIFLIDELFSKRSLTSNITRILLSFFLILFLAKFSRLAEFGSDLSGQIAIVIFFYFCFEILFNQKLIEKLRFEYLKLSLIFLTFAVTLKFILIIYSILLFLVIIEKRKLIKKFLQKLNSIFIITLFLPFMIFIFFNFSSTGCLIYPIERLCFTGFDWTLNSQVVNYLNLHYEIWAKGGKGPGYEVDNPYSYVHTFNWIKNWFNVYFIGKFTDYLLVIFSIQLVFFLTFFKSFIKSKKKINLFNKKNFKIFFTLILIFIIWFLYFPTLRYAGYIIVFVMIIFPIMIYFDKKVDLSSKKNLKRLFFLILISYTIFLYKNVTRINQELKIPIENHHNFKNFPFFWIKENDVKKVFVNGQILYKVNGSCWNTKSTCIRSIENLTVYERKGYLFYKNE